MYTKFTHSMILDARTDIITYAFRSQSVRRARQSGEPASDVFLAAPHHHLYKIIPARWVSSRKLSDKDAKNLAIITLEGLLDRIHFLVTNAYVTFGGEIFHQQIGVAMGLIPAGLIATLVCFHYEIRFLKRCLTRYDTLMNTLPPHDPALEEQKSRVYFILFLKRYIDDCLHTLTNDYDSATALYDERTAFDGSQDGTIVDGIFPKSARGPHGTPVDMPCELEAVHRPSTSITFCDWDITIDVDKGRIVTKVHDKRHRMPLFQHARTFPHVRSLIQLPAKMNVITSQFIRFSRRASSMTAFATAAARLVANMLIHHYPKNQVLRKIAHFHRYWPKYGKHLGSFARFENMFSDFLTNRLAAHKNTMKTRHPKIRQGRHPSSRRDDPSNQHIGDWDTENGARSTSAVPERDAFDLSDINAALRDIDTFPNMNDLYTRLVQIHEDDDAR